MTPAPKHEPTELQQLILDVLAGQSPGYLIDPGAAAFQAVGLDADTVAGELRQLHLDDRVAFSHDEVTYERPIIDKHGRPKLLVDDEGEPVNGVDGEPLLETETETVVVDAGWHLP